MTTAVNATLAGSRPFFTLTPLGALVGNLGAGAKNLFANNPDAVITALFASGEQGAWYDPSDLTTMFQNSTGTTPVTADGQPVGLVLDKSKGLALGAELATTFTTLRSSVTNPSEFPTVVSIVGGVGPFGITGTNLTAGKWYKVEVSYSGSTVTNNTLQLDVGVMLNLDIAVGPSGTLSAVAYIGAGTTWYIYTNSTSGAFTIDSATIREIAGNHASQATAASRPLYKERINLLSYSEDIAAEFDRSYRTTITPNVVMAPNGTVTADLMTEGTNLNTYFGIYRTLYTPVDSGVYTVSAWVKPNGRNHFILYSYGDNSPYDYGKHFELIGSGAVLGDYYMTPINATITPFPDGWYLCTMTVPNSPANNGVAFDMFLSPDGLTDTYNGDGVSGVYLWGAQIEKSAEYTVYQRVEDDVYNTVGTPKWLQFDGVDDELRTADINFSTTDKVSAFSGYLCSSTNGGIITSYLSAPGFAVIHNSGTVRGDLKDTAKVSVASSVSNKHVTSTVFDSAQSTALEQVKQRVDGVSGGSVVAAGPAVGNQGTYAISVGDWLAALPMNGRIYSAIMLGRLATAQEITDTETWVAAKTGVVLP